MSYTVGGRRKRSRSLTRAKGKRAATSAMANVKVISEWHSQRTDFLDLVELLVGAGAAVAPRGVDPVLVRYQVPELQSREGISAAERRGDKSGKGM